MMTGSFGLLILFLTAYASLAPSLNISMELQGIVQPLFGNPVFYLAFILIPLLCLLRDIVWK
jgi:phospholipid-transporting ATPase